MPDSEWPVAEPIETARLRLEPLRVAHADELVDVLDDPRLHTFTGGVPATTEELRARFARQVVGRSPGSDEGWLNWVIRLADDAEPAGTVQATVRRTPGLSAEIAWVVATAHQGAGIATEAATAMVAWLREQGVGELGALIHPDHLASAAVARHVGLVPTDDLVDGEVRWVSPPT